MINVKVWTLIRVRAGGEREMDWMAYDEATARRLAAEYTLKTGHDAEVHDVCVLLYAAVNIELHGTAR